MAVLFCGIVFATYTRVNVSVAGLQLMAGTYKCIAKIAEVCKPTLRTHVHTREPPSQTHVHTRAAAAATRTRVRARSRTCACCAGGHARALLSLLWCALAMAGPATSSHQ